MRQSPAMMIPVNDISVGQRLRTVDPDYVEMLGISVSEVGLMHPIEVGPADNKGRYRLIAGAHRLAAIKVLEQAEIPAVVVSVKGLDAQLREIDENLMRRELTPLDRATFLARRKEIHEAKYPHTKHGGDKSKDQVDKVGDLVGRFTAEVAAKLDVSERSIQRAITRFTKISPDVRNQIATTWIAGKGAVLDALAKEPPETQRGVVAELLAENKPAKTFAEALARVRGASLEEVLSADEQEFNALVKAWRKAGQRTRDRFAEFVNGQSTADMDEAA